MLRGLLAFFAAILISASVAAGVTIYLSHSIQKPQPEVKAEHTEPQRTLDKYSIQALQAANVTPSKIYEDGEDFNFSFDPTLTDGPKKTVTGRITRPQEDGTYPVILMIRGYVDRDLYETGMGTKNAANFFSDNGYITLAPDFLGYAKSSKEADNIYETRFQTYTTAMVLLKSIQAGEVKGWDGKNIFIWAHSNGGQVALTLLTITGDEIPTTLWAPVTKPFPYNVLYYTDESEDGGKYIRSELAKFEKLYDTDKYTFTNYLDNIKAPIQIHQGTSDDAVPYEWSYNFSEKLKSMDKDVNYYQYKGVDHNMRPDWDTVIQRDVDFFKEKTVS